MESLDKVIAILEQHRDEWQAAAERAGYPETGGPFADKLRFAASAIDDAISEIQRQGTTCDTSS